MESTLLLKDLESITNLPEHVLNNYFIAHYNNHGINLAVSVYGKVHILEDTFNRICNYYDKFKAHIPDYDFLRSIKSHLVTIAHGSYVYFLFQDDRIVYVGQTINMCNRLPAHFKDKIFNAVAYIEVPEHERLIIEAMNINYYRGEYNSSFDVCYPMLFSYILNNYFV